MKVAEISTQKTSRICRVSEHIRAIVLFGFVREKRWEDHMWSGLSSIHTVSSSGGLDSIDRTQNDPSGSSDSDAKQNVVTVEWL